MFADLLRPEIVQTLPAGWRTRLVPLPDVPNVRCLEKNDLALVKLSLGREKDMALVRALLALGLLTVADLRRRYQEIPWDEQRLFNIGRRLGELV